MSSRLASCPCSGSPWMRCMRLSVVWGDEKADASLRRWVALKKQHYEDMELETADPIPTKSSSTWSGHFLRLGENSPSTEYDDV